jgi:hypothetical protein
MAQVLPFFLHLRQYLLPLAPASIPTCARIPPASIPYGRHHLAGQWLLLYILAPVQHLQFADNQKDTLFFEKRDNIQRRHKILLANPLDCKKSISFSERLNVDNPYPCTWTANGGGPVKK